MIQVRARCDLEHPVGDDEPRLHRNNALNSWQHLSGAASPRRPLPVTMALATRPYSVGGRNEPGPHPVLSLLKSSCPCRHRRSPWSSSWGHTPDCRSLRQDRLTVRFAFSKPSTPWKHAELSRATEGLRGHGTVRPARQFQRALGCGPATSGRRSQEWSALCLW